MQRQIICRASRLIECVVVFKILTEILVSSFHHRYRCHCHWPDQLPARCRCQPLWRQHCIFLSIYMVMGVVIRTLLALQDFQLHLFQCRHCETVKTRKKKLHYWIGFILFNFKFDKRNFIHSHHQQTTHYTRTTPSTEWKKNRNENLIRISITTNVLFVVMFASVPFIYIVRWRLYDNFRWLTKQFNEKFGRIVLSPFH